MKIRVSEATRTDDMVFGDLQVHVEKVLDDAGEPFATWAAFKRAARQRASDLGKGWRMATLGDIMWLKTFDGPGVKRHPVSGRIDSSGVEMYKVYKNYLSGLRKFIRSQHPDLAGMLDVIHDNKPSFFSEEYPYDRLVEDVLDLRGHEHPEPCVEVESSTWEDFPTYGLCDTGYDQVAMWRQGCIFAYGPRKEVGCLAASLSQYIPAITKKVRPWYAEAEKEASRRQRVASGEDATAALSAARAYAETPGKGQGTYKVSWYDGMRGDPIDRTFTIKANNYLDLYAQVMNEVWFGDFWEDTEADCKLPEDVEEYVGQYRSKAALKKWFEGQDVSDRHVYKISGGDISWRI